MYTPYFYEDVPRDGVPRITNEEYAALLAGSKAAREAKDAWEKLNCDILRRYGKPRQEDFDDDGLPATFWSIKGHNIEKMTVVY
jgi:hypothetical protein